MSAGLIGYAGNKGDFAEKGTKLNVLYDEHDNQIGILYMAGTALNISHRSHVILIELETVITDTWNKRRGLNARGADW